MKLLETTIKEHEKYLPKVLEEIGSNTEQLKKDVENLKEWYSYQTHLPQNINDSVLASFIVGCKNSIEIAKEKIDKFFSEKRLFPTLYGNLDPLSDDLRQSQETVIAVNLPALTPDGCNVTVLKIINLDINKYDVNLPVKRLNMMLELWLHKTPLTCKTIVVYDYQGVTPSHMAKFGLTDMRNQAYLLKFLPFRLKGVIAVNCPKFVEAACKVMKTFVSEKLGNRFYFYAEGVSVLSKHIPKEILPQDLGGDASYTLDELNKEIHGILIENREWFMDDKLHNSEESKRSPNSKYRPDLTSIYGVEGNFKKLAFD